MAAAVGSVFYENTDDARHELSPQDILDRAWYYHNHKLKNVKRDEMGCFQWGLRKAFTFVQNHGVGYLDNYAFEGKLNEDKDPVKNSEVLKFFIHIFSS